MSSTQASEIVPAKPFAAIAVGLGAVVLLAAGFAFLNGVRDASTSVALAVRNRALTPSVGVLLAVQSES